jgi:hypothetical protein
MLMLTDPEGPCFIGDFYHGQTPIRALIHDEILAEVPIPKLDEYYSRLDMAMTHPVKCQPLPKNWDMGEYMIHRAEIKVGDNWADMEAA